MHEDLVSIFTEEITGIMRHRCLTRISANGIQSLSIGEAYAVQERCLASRISHGERPVGYKVGCTSRAIRTQLGLDQPIRGRVVAPHVHQTGVRLRINDYVDCALEAELVLHIGIDLDGTNLEMAHLRSAISAVSPGIEIHNGRFWYGPPSLQELIASNGIHAGLVIGAAKPISPEMDLRQERMSLVVNGIEKASGFGADLMDGLGPLKSLQWLLEHLKERNLSLRAGSLVIPGSATKLIPVKAGDVAEARFTEFGVCRATFTSGT